MPDTDNKKYRNAAGTLVANFLTDRLLNGSAQYKVTPEFILNLRNSLKAIINKVITIMSISKKVTDVQIDNTLSQMIIEIITEPKAYAALPQDKSTKGSLHVSSILREIVSIEKESAALIHSYLTKRIFSLLRYFAEDDCKEYLRINERIKKALKSLKQQNLVFEPMSGHYSSINSPTAIYQKKKCNIKTSEELEAELKKNRPNTKNIILALLRANSNLSFQTKDISSYFASLQQNVSSKKTKPISKEEGEESEEIIDKDPFKNDNFAAKQIAVDSMEVLIHSGCQDTIDKARSEMACLAFLCRTVPSNFSDRILTEAQLQESEANCIELFLNDNRFVVFNKSKHVGRTTAYNFLKKGQTALKTVLRDLETDIQIEFIKCYSRYLEVRFEELTKK